MAGSFPLDQPQDVNEQVYEKRRSGDDKIPNVHVRKYAFDTDVKCQNDYDNPRCQDPEFAVADDFCSKGFGVLRAEPLQEQSHDEDIVSHYQNGYFPGPDALDFPNHRIKRENKVVGGGLKHQEDGIADAPMQHARVESRVGFSAFLYRGNDHEIRDDSTDDDDGRRNSEVIWKVFRLAVIVTGVWGHLKRKLIHARKGTDRKTYHCALGQETTLSAKLQI